MAKAIYLCNFGRSHHEEQFCEIILIWTKDSGGDVVSRYFLFRALAAPSFGGEEALILCNFHKGHFEKQFCDIILTLDQWFRRCHLKIFLI